MRIPKVALACIEPTLPPSAYAPFSYGVRRIQASLLQDPRLELDLALLESHCDEVDYWVERLEALDPDLIGFSAYVWSFPTFVEVARQLKARRPDRLVIFGGPSARPAMLALEPYAEGRHSVDALVTSDGEGVFADIAEIALQDRSALASVPGLLFSTREGFLPTGARKALTFDQYPSPTQMGLVPSGRTVALETYRGCPLSCAFCQWGDLKSPDDIASTEFLVRELEALRAMKAPSAQQVDAGFNLNSRAFRRLVEAEREVGFFRDAYFFTSVYPSKLNAEHIDFLRRAKKVRIDVGLQSYNDDALDSMDRPFSEGRFRAVLDELARFAEVEVEIILGLPGDNPASFRRTLERARELPCKLRVFHCLVLPDALMTRAPASYAMDFDPISLRMRACLGFRTEELEAERAFLDREIAASGGVSGNDMWQFPGPRGRDLAEASGDPGKEALAALDAVVGAATGGSWKLRAVRWDGDGLLLEIETRGGELRVELRPAQEGGRAFRTAGGIATSYRPRQGAEISRSELEQLGRVAEAIPATARAVLYRSLRGQLPVVS